MSLHRRVARSDESAHELSINPLYARVNTLASIPKLAMPQHSMLPETALQVVRDELMLDGNARQNLATFVTTWMEPQARELIAECLDRNMIDKDEDPQTAEL